MFGLAPDYQHTGTDVIKYRIVVDSLFSSAIQLFEENVDPSIIKQRSDCDIDISNQKNIWEDSSPGGLRQHVLLVPDLNGSQP